MTFDWGLLLGFVLSAVSSAVVVPSLLRLKDQGWGTDQGIPSMVLAAASLDNVLSIVGFGIMLPVALPPRSDDTAARQLVAEASSPTAAAGISSGILRLALNGPIALVVAAGVAWLLGRGIARVLSPAQPAAYRFSAAVRSAVVVALCAGIALTGAQTSLTGAGATAVLVLGVALAWQWKKDGTASEAVPAVAAGLSAAWNLSEPALFALIGASLDLGRISLSLVGLSVAIVAAGLCVRWVVAVLATARARGLTWQDRSFIGIAWLPKATVQAAIGGVALDHAVALGYPSGSREYTNAHAVLTAAVVVILLTAPAGAAAMDHAGPRLLRRARDDGDGGGNGPANAPLVKGGNEPAGVTGLEKEPASVTGLEKEPASAGAGGEAGSGALRAGTGVATAAAVELAVVSGPSATPGGAGGGMDVEVGRAVCGQG